MALALPMAALVGASPTTEDFETWGAANTPGDSVEGLGTVHADLNIDSATENIVLIKTGVGTVGDGKWGYNTTPSAIVNGCLPSGVYGIADGDDDVDEGFEVTFGGNTVSSFSIVMLDYGDYFPHAASYASPLTHTIKLVGYDAGDVMVDDDVLTFTSTGGGSTMRTCTSHTWAFGGTSLSVAGDACPARALNQSPGRWQFTVTGTGIAKVAVEFVGDQSVDSGVGWDNISFEIEPLIEVDKDYRYTNVCFERDNDLDGWFNEDPVNFEIDGITPIDDDDDGLFNEDDIDCPLGSYLGDLLPMDNGNYVVEAVIHPKNNKVRSYNPGQYYAVSTVTVLDDVDTLTIMEDWDDCDEISTLNPRNGGGCVVIVQVGGEINGAPVPDPSAAYQIMDADSEDVTISGNTATAVLEDVKAGTIILMYVKFGPGLKGQPWDPPNDHYGPCENLNWASVLADPDPEEPGDWVEASANLIVVEKE